MSWKCLPWATTLCIESSWTIQFLCCISSFAPSRPTDGVYWDPSLLNGGIRLSCSVTFGFFTIQYATGTFREFQSHHVFTRSKLICSMYGIFTNICPDNHPNVGKYTRKHPDSPTPLLCCTLGDQLGRSTRVFREYKFPTPAKLLHSLKIFNKGLILPPPSNFYIHWRSSIRV